MKKIKKKVLLIPLAFLMLLLTYGLFFYFNFFQGYVTVTENNISTKNKVSDNFKSSYNSSIDFNNLSSFKISNDITIKILDKDLPLTNIYEKSLRYYIPLDIVCSTLNYDLNELNDKIIITNSSTTIIFENNNSCFINDKPYTMRGNLLLKENKKYISISDIEYLFNLTAVFNFDSKEISLLNKLPSSNIENTSNVNSGSAALLRLEDFSAGYGTLNSENQLKYKCIGNLLKSNNIKFHIAWVPRFISPSDNIDNNLLENNNIENVGFINTLDYLINSGAEIGLHGYTHQSGEETSLVGTELSFNRNSTDKDTRKVIENAIDTAKSLNIPYNFFESTHYKATVKQKKIIEEYFQFLYEPENILLYTKLQKHNNNLYIPTPLGYVENLDTTRIEKYLNSPLPNQLASLFYHPALELDYINLTIQDLDINIDYNNDSPLSKIIKSLMNNNYITIYVTDLKQ